VLLHYGRCAGAQVRGPLTPSDVVTSSLHVNVVDDECVHLCHSDGRTSTNVSFVVVALSPYHLQDVVIDFGDGVTTDGPAGVARRRDDDLPSTPSWAAECYRHDGQTAVLWHVYADIGNFTASASMTVCNATCGRASTLTVGSQQLFVELLGSVDIRPASVRRINDTVWHVKFVVGVESDAAAADVTLDFDDGTSSSVTLGNASLVADQLPYPDTWSVAEITHTYRVPQNYTVTLTIRSQVDQRWTVTSNTLVRSLLERLNFLLNN